MRKHGIPKLEQTEDRKVPLRRFRFLSHEEFEALSELEKTEYKRAARAATLEREKSSVAPPKIWD